MIVFKNCVKNKKYIDLNFFYQDDKKKPRENKGKIKKQKKGHAWSPGLLHLYHPPLI